MQETQVWSLGQENPLEKEVATHSSILAWKILCTEEPGRPWDPKELDTIEQLDDMMWLAINLYLFLLEKNTSNIYGFQNEEGYTDTKEINL